jgi:cytochrome b
MPAHVVLWDPFVRLAHWTLAATFLISRFFTDESDAPHAWFGYAAAALVLARVAWGFRVAGAASWSQFWPTRQRLAQHWRELRRGEPHRELGHSPFGALVMISMMAGVVALAITGYAMEEIDYFWGDERMFIAHDWIAQFVTALAALHVVAAVVQSVWLRENLPLSMITGRRRRPE